MGIGIGIDTGGTYTDAVAYDFDAQRVLAAAKAQTTKADLSVGIGAALDALPLDLVRSAEMISLSTTLATNACVEDKGGRARLLFIGVQPWIVERYGAEYGLPSDGEIFHVDAKTTTAGEIVRTRTGTRSFGPVEHGSRTPAVQASWISTPWTTAARWRSRPACSLAPLSTYPWSAATNCSRTSTLYAGDPVCSLTPGLFPSSTSSSLPRAPHYASAPSPPRWSS